MSDEKDQKTEGGGKASPPGPSKLPLILMLVNFLAIGGALGTLVYTRLLFKRPPITEDGERKRLAKLASEKPAAPTEAGTVSFDAAPINIVRENGGVGKAHYVTIGFALEIRDKNRQGDVEAVRALLMDRFLGIVGRKQITELNQVQGRYLLRSELIDAFNQIIFSNAGKIQAPAAPKPAGEEGGGEGGHEGGGGEGAAHAEGGGELGGAKEAHAGAPGAGEAEKKPIKDLVTNIYFTQFLVQ